MKINYSIEGKRVAEVKEASYVPREGDWIFLDIGGKSALHEVLRVTWDYDPIDETGVTPRQLREADVFILIKALEEKK